MIIAPSGKAIAALNLSAYFHRVLYTRYLPGLNLILLLYFAYVSQKQKQLKSNFSYCPDCESIKNIPETRTIHTK